MVYIRSREHREGGSSLSSPPSSKASINFLKSTILLSGFIGYFHIAPPPLKFSVECNAFTSPVPESNSPTITYVPVHRLVDVPKLKILLNGLL